MTARHSLDQIVRGLDGVTAGEWSWTIFDHSCAALGVGSDPGCGTPHVLSISPCKSCQARAEQWEWGRCTTPSETDAMHIARCSPDAIREIASYVAETEARATAAEATVTALQEKLVVPYWQPIETAPKDGTRILVTDARGHVQVGACGNTLRKKQEWRAEYQLGRVLYPQPSHWQPLPASPEQGETE